MRGSPTLWCARNLDKSSCEPCYKHSDHRSGWPRVTSNVQDRFIRLRSVRNKFEIAVTIATDLPFRRRISLKKV